MARVEDLETLSFFSELKAMELSIVASYLVRRSFQAGTPIFKEGSPGDSIYFVITGKVQIVKSSLTGEDKAIADIPAGNIFGEMAILDRCPRSAGAIALTPTDVLEMTRENFFDILERYPRIASKLLIKIGRILSLRLRRATASII